MDGALNYTQHKAAHALAGSAYGLATGTSPLATAISPVTAEIVGEAAFRNGFDIETSANLAKITGATTGLATGDVQVASSYSSTAADNNFVPFAIVALDQKYCSYYYIYNGIS